jgi:hypothetical protein
MTYRETRAKRDVVDLESRAVFPQFKRAVSGGPGIRTLEEHHRFFGK